MVLINCQEKNATSHDLYDKEIEKSKDFEKIEGYFENISFDINGANPEAHTSFMNFGDVFFQDSIEISPTYYFVFRDSILIQLNANYTVQNFNSSGLDFNILEQKIYEKQVLEIQKLIGMSFEKKVEQDSSTFPSVQYEFLKNNPQ